MDITKYTAAYKGPYVDALAELASLIDRLEQIDIERDDVITRIGEVREGIAALAPLVKANPVETHPELFPDDSNAGADLGLTDAIRRVLANSAPKRLTPVGVRTGLTAIGFKSTSKNILPSIHSVLKRLEKAKEVDSKSGEDGRTWYGWNMPDLRDALKRRFAPPVYIPRDTEETPNRIAARAAMESAKKSGEEKEQRYRVTPLDAPSFKKRFAAGLNKPPKENPYKEAAEKLAEKKGEKND